MSALDQILPGFVEACSDVHVLLLPWAMALLVIGVGVEFWHGPPSAGGLIQFLVKLFLVVLLLAESSTLINEGQVYVHDWVERNIPARPENVAARFKDKLAESQNEPALADQSFLGTLFSSNWFEAIIFACLTLISWLAMAVLFFVYCVQRAALLLCWALSPLLFPLMAIRPLSSLGLAHLMRIVGIQLWPVGLALAATFTDGLLDLTANPTFLGPSIAGSVGRGLTSLLAVALVALWILFSTVLAPAYIQRLFAGATGPAGLVTQVGGIAANTGLPMVLQAPAAGRRTYERGRAVVESAAWLWRRPDPPPSPPPMPMSPIPPTASAQPSVPWQLDPTDPTGDAAARAILNRTKQV